MTTTASKFCKIVMPLSTCKNWGENAAVLNWTETQLLSWLENGRINPNGITAKRTVRYFREQVARG